MEIKVTSGIGEGQTELAAFDRALFDAGIANYNLVALSSVIPPNSTITVEKVDWNQREYGNRLYLVISRKTEITSSREAWAGLGWAQHDDNRGIFVEHEGSSEKAVVGLINETLTEMETYRPAQYTEKSHKAVGIACTGKPVCAIVCALYKTEGW